MQPFLFCCTEAGMASSVAAERKEALLPVCSYVGVRDAVSTGQSAIQAQKMDVTFLAL